MPKEIGTFSTFSKEKISKMVSDQSTYCNYLFKCLNDQIKIITNKDSSIDDLDRAYAIYKSLRNTYYLELSLLCVYRRYAFYGKVC